MHLTNAGATMSNGTNARLELNSTAGSAYHFSLAPVHYQGTLTFTITSGHLPAGLTLNPHTGVISGTPTATGTFDFEVKVTDDLGAAGVIIEDPAYSITVSPAAPDTGFGTPNIALPLVLMISGMIGVALLFRKFDHVK